MSKRIAAVVLSLIVSAACGTNPVEPVTPAAPTMAVGQVPAAPGTTAAASAPQSASGERPWKAKLAWRVTDIRWAGVPGVDKSTFSGRCSVPSDYVIQGAFEGEATHAGHVTGLADHCSQITWGPQGPIGAVYSDGRGMMVSANGSTLEFRYGNGTTGVDTSAGLQWFRDEWQFTGGTGSFAGATGQGSEGGSFADFNALLAGAPASMWMEGTISYRPSGK
jgi:hypothetical protein